MLCLILLLVLLPLNAQGAPKDIADGSLLTLADCIAIAVQRSPSLAQYRAQTLASDALVGQARSSYYPRVDLKAGGMRRNAVTQFGDPYTPLSHYGYRYGEVNLAVTQRLYDFGKREDTVAAAQMNALATRAEEENVRAAVINAVTIAYYNVLRAKRARDVAVELRDQYRRQLEQARHFFTVGKKPRYDVTAAEVNLQAGEVGLIGAENDLENAWVALSGAMGYEGRARYDIKDDLAVEPLDITEDKALDMALSRRQDLKSLLAQKEAAQKTLSAAKREYFPAIEASAGYDVSGSQTPLSQGWNAGIGLSWNLFQGFATKMEVEKAAAQLKEVEAKIAGLKIAIQQEIRRYLLDLKKARQTIVAADVQVKRATENLELVNLRYETGLATPVDVANAAVAYSDAKLTRVEALYNYGVARANLQKAMGGD
ncbi:MAG: TolC family protein [Syntrophales bacterium]|nr:TolC family protein [Syntrophales bacterium]